MKTALITIAARRIEHLRKQIEAVTLSDRPLPLAAARNLVAREALRHSADLLIFLDVDCMPDRRTIARYHDIGTDHPNALLCGPVTYLPPPPPEGYDVSSLPHRRDPHPDRPTPADDRVLTGADHNLFWSLSFAVLARTWETTGGFDPRYRGYGAEDTDFAYRANHTGVGMYWVRGAHAYHQHDRLGLRPPRDGRTRAQIGNCARWGSSRTAARSRRRSPS